MLRQGVHIESIRRNVMSCGGEAHYPEYCQCQLEEEGSGDGKCNACQCKGKDVLHDDGPPPFSLDQVDKWTPERLDYPWQVEPTGVESDIRVGYSQTLVHDDGNGHHGYVGQTLYLTEDRNLLLELRGYCISPVIQGLYDVDLIYNVSAGLTWTFAKKKMRLTVRGNDLFEGGNPVTRVDEQGQKSRMKLWQDSRNVTLTLRYSFGGYKEKKAKEVDTSRLGTGI